MVYRFLHLRVPIALTALVLLAISLWLMLGECGGSFETAAALAVTNGETTVTMVIETRFDTQAVSTIDPSVSAADTMSGNSELDHVSAVSAVTGRMLPGRSQANIERQNETRQDVRWLSGFGRKLTVT